MLDGHHPRHGRQRLDGLEPGLVGLQIRCGPLAVRHEYRKLRIEQRLPHLVVERLLFERPLGLLLRQDILLRDDRGHNRDLLHVQTRLLDAKLSAEQCHHVPGTRNILAQPLRLNVLVGAIKAEFLRIDESL